MYTSVWVRRISLHKNQIPVRDSLPWCNHILQLWLNSKSVSYMIPRILQIYDVQLPRKYNEFRKYIGCEIVVFTLNAYQFSEKVLETTLCALNVFTCFLRVVQNCRSLKEFHESYASFFIRFWVLLSMHSSSPPVRLFSSALWWLHAFPSASL